MTKKYNKGVNPLITPGKEKNIKTKYEKTNTTRRKRPPCPLFLNVFIRNLNYFKGKDLWIPD